MNIFRTGIKILLRLFSSSAVRVACLSPRDVSFWKHVGPPSYCKHWCLCWSLPGSTVVLMPSRSVSWHYADVRSWLWFVLKFCPLLMLFVHRISSTPARILWSQLTKSSLIETSRRKWTFSARFFQVCHLGTTLSCSWEISEALVQQCSFPLMAMNRTRLSKDILMRQPCVSESFM